MDAGVGRVLDVNINRGQEGLRVCEEYARFILENPALSELLKSLRHRFISAEKILTESAGKGLHTFRDTAGDVGTQITISSESSRSTPENVVKASIKRLQEALRVLEEYGKTVSVEAAAEFEKIRYQSYDLEKTMLSSDGLRKRIKDAKLYVIITAELASAPPLTVVRELINGGVDVIQVREKNMEDGAFYQQALMMRQVCGDNAVFLVNDRPHIAKLIKADGVHTGQGDLPANLVRRLIGHDKILGKSTSSPEYAEAALRDGVDYIGVGPVYPTNTKQHREAVGLEYVKWAAKNAKMPYFCIGSVNRETLPGILDAGARAVAVCTAIIGAKDIAAEAAWYKEQLMQVAGE